MKVLHPNPLESWVGPWVFGSKDLWRPLPGLYESSYSSTPLTFYWGIWPFVSTSGKHSLIQTFSEKNSNHINSTQTRLNEITLPHTYPHYSTKKNIYISNNKKPVSIQTTLESPLSLYDIKHNIASKPHIQSCEKQSTPFWIQLFYISGHNKNRLVISRS